MKNKILFIFALLATALFGQVTPGGGIQQINKGGTGKATASAALDNLSATAETAVASAGTTDLGAVAAQQVSITGTVTITSFGSTAAAGVRREGRFTGALTLTHNATSLILPGAASITTAAGDRFSAYSLGSGNWVVTSYTKANGSAVNSTLVLDFTYSTAPSGATGGSGSWSYTFSDAAKTVQFFIVGGGGSGGAGARLASGQNGRGGGAGGTGMKVQNLTALPITTLGSTTITVSIGAAATGAVGQTTNDTAGANGSTGGTVSVTCGGKTLFFAAGGGAGTGGGNAAGGTAGSGGSAGLADGYFAYTTTGNTGGAGGTTGAGSVGAGSTIANTSVTGAILFPFGGEAGSGGGAISIAPAAFAGANGSTVISTTSTLLTGGTGGANTGGTGGSGNNYGERYSGAGGGGANLSGAGGNGGTPNSAAYGASGAGGGASLNGNTSGAGGNGVAGVVRIIVGF